MAIFKSRGFKFRPFLAGVAGIATIESLICILQFFGLSKSENKFFTVTGSWNNPNVTAIFLALTVPVFLHLFQTRYRKLIVAGFLSILTAMLLLKCRTAFIGTILSVLVFYSLEYKLTDWIKNKKNSTTVKAVFIIALMIGFALSSRLYNAKKDSADGRKLIWKIAAMMAAEKPLTGYGYGYFEKEYNLYQASYIQKGKATTEELSNAGPVIMPHNEILQNAVEGGSIGLVIISLFFGSLFFSIKQKNNTNLNDLNPEIDLQSNRIFNLAFAGIASFTVMSMVNSTMQIVPVMCLCILYSAIICSALDRSQFFRILSVIEKSKTFSNLSIIGILIISFYLSYLIFGMAQADMQNKKSRILKETGQNERALKTMPYLEKWLKKDPNYWKNYGAIYFEKQSYRKALNCFQKAQALSSLPDIYLGTGICHEKLKQYPQAVQQYEILTALYPIKFSYRMRLLKAYLKNKETDKAIALAHEIIQLQPKIPSEKVNQYKKICLILLQNVEKQNYQLNHTEN
ncbi:O-antigen ligase family protein [Flavobacterium flavigenum]|uniref:O-antigen ligase family protein n=1 Tax=Flavobacterium flavigenum TaxID=3003258 RepID=UPI002483163A|nr:O-antigen ligase family protein [Flavobacterium flavigenum]